eukprot:scaffold130748_cov41-Tisochrysis_lutea.AAC.1
MNAEGHELRLGTMTKSRPSAQYDAAVGSLLQRGFHSVVPCYFCDPEMLSANGVYLACMFGMHSNCVRAPGEETKMLKIQATTATYGAPITFT